MSKDIRIQTRLLYATILILIIGIALFTFLSLNTLISRSERVAHTHSAINQGQQLNELLLEMQVNKRGFVITGQSSFFEHYVRTKGTFEALLSTMQKLVQDNPKQVERLKTILTLMHRWHQTIADAEIAMRKTLNGNARKMEALQTTIAKQQTKSILAQINTVLKLLRRETQRREDLKAENRVLALAHTIANQEAQLSHFLLTNERTFIDTYQAEQKTLQEQIADFKNYLSGQIGKTSLLSHLQELETLLENWHQKTVQPKLELHQQVTNNQVTFAKIATLVKQGVSTEIMAELQAQLKLFVEHEQNLLVQRDQEENAIARLTMGVVTGGNALIILLGIVVILFFSRQDWLKNGQTQLGEKMKGEQDITTLAKNVIAYLSIYLKAKVGLLYLRDNSDYLQLAGSYAYSLPKGVPEKFALGEGLIGEAALEQRAIAYTHTVEEYRYVIQSGLAQVIPRCVLLVPLVYESKLVGIIELGSTHPLKKLQQRLLTEVTPSIGIALNMAVSRTRMQTLLKQSQQQERALQDQQEELQQANEELQTQSAELKAQQEELLQANEALKQRTAELERQREEIKEKNRNLEAFQEKLMKLQTATEEKAQELAISSKYKSEFLANMSHELRTPLNSVLMLAQLLAENKEGNLTEKQIEHVNTIYHSGSDLLSLINDVLDLSKIEAGKMEIHYEQVPLTSFIDSFKQKFKALAETKELDFQVIIDEQLPTLFKTDVQRLRQIIVNLLSNAFKFTAQGSIQLILERPTLDEAKTYDFSSNQTIAIRIADTGVGIPIDKQQLIFEAFQQVDGTISRRYGGTGLGLSISKQLTKLLGGKLGLESAENQGCTFTLYLPEAPLQTIDQTPLLLLEEKKSEIVIDPEPDIESETPLSNKRDVLKDKTILIVDDDQRNVFAMTLVLDNKGMTTLSCSNGKEALAFLEKNQDIDIVLMDIMMPEMDGYQTIQKIREQPHFQKLPIIALTAKAMKGDKEKCMEAGASDYLTKPVSNEQLISLIRVWLS